jgi:hypothetical protein
MWQVPRELLVCNVCNTVPGLGMVWHGAKESVVIVKGMNLDDNLGSLGSWQFEFELGSFSHENYHGTANQSIWQAKTLSHTMLTSEKKQVTMPPTQPILECWNAGPMHFAEQISLGAFFSCRPRPPKKAWSIPLNCETPLVQKKRH